MKSYLLIYVIHIQIINIYVYNNNNKKMTKIIIFFYTNNKLNGTYQKFN